MNRATSAAAAAFLAVATGASAGEFNIGAGATLDLGTGSLDLGCADLTVGGTFSAGTVGFAQARDVTIDPTGLVNGNSATLEGAGASKRRLDDRLRTHTSPWPYTRE
jgi:hypothetical protein